MMSSSAVVKAALPIPAEERTLAVSSHCLDLKENQLTPITLTREGRIIGKAQLHDAPENMRWTIIAMCFPERRSITRTNDEWRVELEHE